MDEITQTTKPITFEDSSLDYLSKKSGWAKWRTTYQLNNKTIFVDTFELCGDFNEELEKLNYNRSYPYSNSLDALYMAYSNAIGSKNEKRLSEFKDFFADDYDEFIKRWKEN